MAYNCGTVLYYSGCSGKSGELVSSHLSVSHKHFATPEILLFSFHRQEINQGDTFLPCQRKSFLSPLERLKMKHRGHGMDSYLLHLMNGT